MNSLNTVLNILIYIFIIILVLIGIGVVIYLIVVASQTEEFLNDKKLKNGYKGEEKTNVEVINTNIETTAKETDNKNINEKVEK